MVTFNIKIEPNRHIKFKVKSKNFLLFIILLLALSLRLLVFFEVPFTNADGILYSWIGVNLADGYGYSIGAGDTLSTYSNWRVPAYPIILAMFYYIFGKGFLISKVPSMIFGILIILLTYLITKNFFNKTAAFISAVFVSFSPIMVIQSAEIMAESMFTFFILGYVYFLFKYSENGTHWLHIGLFIGLSYLTKPVGIYLLPLTFIYFLIKREHPIVILIFLAGFLIVVLPWWCFSYMEYGTPFSHERSTAIYEFYEEKGYYPNKKISMLSYIFEYHSLQNILKLMISGYIEIIKSLREYFTIFGLLMIPIIFLIEKIGVYAERIILLFTIILLGMIIPAWQANLLSQLDMRYLMPFLPLLYIVFSIIIVKIFNLKVPLVSVLMLLFVLYIIVSYIIMLDEYVENTKKIYEYQYDYITEEFPRDLPVVASNPYQLKKRGFTRVYPLEDGNFRDIIALSEKYGVKYLFIDSTSLYNDDQFYLLTERYFEKWPPEIKRVRGIRYYIMKYRISTDG